jgi:Fur family transcriptional regulator, ferric uptake regulator
MTAMSEDLHATVAGRLASADGRYTGGRRALVEVLLAAGRPLTVEEILDRSAAVRQSSVYRNLAVFEEQGLVHRVAGHDEFTRYELAEEIVGHHHHFACRSCGAVADVELPHDLEEALGRTLAELSRRSGHTVEAHRLDVVGLCRDCAGASQSNAARRNSAKSSTSSAS